MSNSVIRRPFQYTYTNATFIIIGINLLFYILNEIIPNSRIYTALNVTYVLQAHYYWQFITYMFTHANLSHIFFNMLGLFFFGIATEKTLGSKEFILFYLLIGFFSGLVSFLVYWVTGSYYTFLLGASGAVYGVLFLYAVLFPSSKIYIWGILPIPAPLLVAIYAGIEIASQFMNTQSGISHMTHLSGFLFTWLYIRIRLGIKPWQVWKNTFR
ncbi:MAG: glpG protein [Treponema sp. CETP13]|nr:MAG: glpG protein [Treponema sp. CETP13]